MGLEHKAEFFQDRISSYMLVAPASRMDRAIHPRAALLLKLHLAKGKKLQDSNLLSKRALKLTAPFNIEKLYMSNLTEKKSYEMSDLGLHNYWGHYQSGCSVQNVKHWGQIFNSKKF